ncbi:MAG TPA: heme NO-binding domain-containing protein [Gaiellaceae bacterium]|nr:heme NO-binding domain-containing protein [Gaiellaceae bacterium]
MHGLIFAGLRAYSFERLGSDAAERLWAGHSYDPTQAYEDEDFLARLEALRATTGDSVDELQRAFGVFTGQTTFAALYPDYYDANDGTLPFLLGVEEQIHTVVRATIHGSRPPKLHVLALGTGGVLVSYTSERGLCRLLEGLVHGVARHYGEAVVVEEIQCMREGDPGCVYSVLQAAA